MDKQENSRLTFGLLLDWVVEKGDTTYYQAKILSAVDEYTKEHDINLISFITGRLDSPIEWEKSRNILYEFVNKNTLDGLIVVTATIGRLSSKDRMRELFERYIDLPIVTISVNVDGYPYSTINNYNGMKKIVNHLIEVHDCKKVAYIKGLENNEESQIRYKAYEDSLLEHNIPINPDLVYPGDFLYTSGAEAVRVWMDEKNVQFDSISAANDCMAIGALIELQKRLGKNSKLPPITGFDNIEISNYYLISTINQSFSGQAKNAADMLLRMIRGEKVDLVEEIDCELVIRSSCGCVPNRIENVFPKAYNTLDESFKSAYHRTKAFTLLELSDLNKSYDISNNIELFEFEQRILEAIFDEILLDKNNHFLSIWSCFISWAMVVTINLDLLQYILSSLRKNIMQCLSDKKDIVKVENLFQEARIELVQVIMNSKTSTNLISDFDAESFDFLAEELMANLDYKNQMDSIFNRITEFGVEQCYISLFEDPQFPLQYSRLFLGFNEQLRYPIEYEGIRFNTTELLPKKVLRDSKKERSSMLVMALYQGSIQLGFYLINYNKKTYKILDSIRFRLSVALKGTFLIEKIRHQAQNLEKQVIGRTKELVLTNKQLQKEIAEKEKTENLLKETMENLKSLNEKLQNMSIKDELTGLYNRRGFWTIGFEYYEHAISTKTNFVMLFADIDGLKQINDKYGHQEGDYAICKISQVLICSFRNKDIISRLGGDEFTIIAMNSRQKDVESIINRLNAAIDDISKKETKPYKLSISFGMSCFDPYNTKSFEELIANADRLLYAEKQKKKEALRIQM